MKKQLQDYAGLSSVIFGHPLAIDPSFLRVIQQTNVEPKAFFTMFAEMGPSMEDEGPIAIIKVMGTLYRGMFFDDYQDIGAMFDRAMENPSVTGILLDINSPGGQVAGAFQLSEHIMEARGEKPIWAFANDQMTSAAYAIGSAADHVVASSTAIIGSIGVLAMHVDRSEMENKAGVKFTEVASGKQKTALSPHKPLSKDGREHLREMVNQDMDVFAAHVASARGMSEDAVRDQEAAVFTADQSIEQGLADEILNFDAVIEKMTALKSSAASAGATVASRGNKPMAAADVVEEEDVTDPKKKGEGTNESAASTNVVDIEEARDVAKREANAEAQSRATQINTMCAVGNVPERAGAFIADANMSIEGVGAAILKARAEDDESSAQSNGAHDHNDGSDDTQKVEINPTAIYEKRARDVDAFNARQGGS